jgi:4-amino-4-deoxy-L-arabinose transferase-like glycosyltransferase
MIRAKIAEVVRWVQRNSLGFALLLGTGLRLVALESRSLQYDDAFSIFLAVRSLPEIVTGTAADTMPPLYYFLLHFWMLISQEIWFIRLLSVITGLLLIVLVYQIVKLWSGRPAAGWAAVLAAISPLQIYHAQDIRMYALLVLGQAGYLWFFSRLWFARVEGKPLLWNWVGLILSGLVAVYSHNLAVFALVIPDLFLLVQRRWKMLAQLIAGQALIGLGALPWWMLLPGQLQKIQNAFWTPRPGLVEIFQAIIMFTAAMPLPQILMIIAAVLSLQILVMVLMEFWRYGRRDLGAWFLVGVFIIPPALLFAVSYLMRPVFVPRGFLVSSLSYFGLAGFAITRSWSRGAGKLIAAAFILAAALTLPSYYSYNSFPRSPYKEAAAYMGQANKRDAVVIHETKLSYFPMHFYAPDLPQAFLADVPGSANDTFAPASQSAMNLFPAHDLFSAAQGKQTIFFVTFSQVFTEYQQIGISEHPSIKWLNENYRFASRRVFNDLEVFQYEK